MNILSAPQRESDPRLLVCLLFLLGLTLRLLLVAEQNLLLIEQHPAGSDMLYYYTWAQKIYHGENITEVFSATPLYPYLLGGIFKICGGSLKAVLALQIILGLFSAYLLYRIARQFFPLPVALMALFFYLIYGQLILYEQVLLTDSLGIFLALLFLTTALALQRNPSAWRALSAGVVLGLSALNRLIMLGFLPLFFFWVLFLFPGRLIKRLSWGLLIGGSTFLMILPATLHNYRLGGGFVLISYNGGVNFYLGNGEGSQGWFRYPPRYQEIKEQMYQEKLNPGQESRRWYQETFRDIKSNPWNYVSLVWKKFNLFWGRWEIPQDLHYAVIWARYPLLRIPLLTFGIIAPLGLLGALMLLRVPRDPSISILLLFGAYYSLAVINFVVVGRYRLPLVPLLILGGAHALWSMTEMLRQGEYRELILYFTLLGMLWLFINYKTLYFALGV